MKVTCLIRKASKLTRGLPDHFHNFFTLIFDQNKLVSTLNCSKLKLNKNVMKIYLFIPLTLFFFL